MVRKIAAVSTLVVGLVCAGAIPAWAHVTVAPESAAKGASDVALTFRVPNESATATTNKVTIQLPSDAGLLASVRYLPVAGWTAELVTTKLAKPIVNGDETTTEAAAEPTVDAVTLVDVDGDGTVDAVITTTESGETVIAIDEDGDGNADVLLVDVDGDGTIDAIATLDEDGEVVEVFEVVEESTEAPAAE